jgi:cytochrome c peroxidase
MKNFTLLLLVCSLFVISCTKDYSDTYNESYRVEDYEVLQAAGLDLPSQMFDYNENNTTFNTHDNALVTLGRVLFYDEALAPAGGVSCGTCHSQAHAFADSKAQSDGINGQVTVRNSPALGQFQNFRQYYGGSNPLPLFWDGRQESFHDQMMETMANPVEMGININELQDRIENIDYYKVLYSRAYGPGPVSVSAERITEPMDAFMKTLMNNDSKFDEARGSSSLFNDYSAFTDSENRGKALFVSSGCESCHLMDQVNVVEFASNGLDMNPQDRGLGAVSFNTSDNGKFKTPKLRNIEVTGPYMHDGRFETLEEVIDFYSTGIQNTDNLHQNLKNGSQAKKFNFTDTQKTDLINFLKTLTDDTLLTDERWSNPYGE